MKWKGDSEMEVTLKKLVKCVFKSGRQDLVREMLLEELNRDKIINYVGEGIVYGINHGINAIPQEKRGTLHTAFETAHNATGRLLEVTDPQSENGFEISPRETETICDDLRCITSNVFTDETVAALHEKIIAKVP